jgi:hypothetical protein
LSPQTLTGATGSAGPTAVIGQIEVLPAGGPTDLAAQYPLDQEVNGLSLLGYSQDRQEAIPGEVMLLTLFWLREEDWQGQDGELALDLLDEDGQVAQSWTLPPVRTDYPPEAWPSGQGQRGQHILRLAGGLPSGDYTFELEGTRLGSLSVEAPERLFAEPDYQVPAGVEFAGVAELAGYTLKYDPAEPQTLTLTLVWRGLAEMPISYRVFVHVVDDDGLIVDQSDAEPAAWQRPTTGWVTGEYVVDQHILHLPDGLPLDDMKLRIGLYDAESGDRLPTGGADAFEVSFGGR